LLGTHNDLELVHNDDDAYIRNNKGALILRNNGQTGDADASQIYIQATPAENSISCAPNGAVTLYHDNDPKMATNAAGVTIYKDLDVDGHTNLDNISVAGVTTFTGVTNHNSTIQMLNSNVIRLLNGANSASTEIKCDGGARLHITSYNQTMATFEQGSAVTFYTDNGKNRLQISDNGNVAIAKDLDVDGHTNLDNVSIAGVATVYGTSSYDILQLRAQDSNGIANLNIYSNGTTGHSRILFSDTANSSGDGWVNYNHTHRMLTFTTAGTSNERLRITSTGKVGINFAATPPGETFMIRPASDETVSRVTLSHISSGNSYGARISTIGGTSKGFDLATVFNSTYVTRARMTDTGAFKLSPSNAISSTSSSYVLNIATNYHSGNNPVYSGISLKNLENNGGDGMCIHTTSGNWDLYTNAGNEYGLSIARATNASSNNSRFYLAQGGNLTIGNAVNQRLSTSRKGHTMFHVVGGGISVGCKGNTGNTVEGGRYVLGWYMVTHTSSKSYTHLITDLWAGGSPHGNNEYIMGGFHIHGHQYSGGASVSRERIYFHNWSGSYPGLSNSNPGTWTAGSTIYTSSGGYVAIRLVGGSYRGYIIDLVQHAWYPVRDITITSVITSDNTTE